jgi:tRNA-splicing ligase RtcB
MIIKEGKNVPIASWCNNPEEEALKQAYNLSALPFVFRKVCLMPDTHCGYGMPIGGVVATKGVVVPFMVGVDIGCGMCAVKTSLRIEQMSQEIIKRLFGRSKEFHGGIRSYIPVGFNRHSKKQDESLMPERCTKISYPIIEREYESALHQLGTLGGGNHFIEIQKDQDGYIWIMIHSGSRNLGYKVADYYNKLAIFQNDRWYSSVPKENQLAFLPINSEEGSNYLIEMKYCVNFAYANRKLMMENIKKCFLEVIPETTFEEMINIAHNYVAIENHFGSDVWIHRKGATLAREGTMGIIPGSQGSSSYIVKGKGNPESFMSCSHGAGRKMSRTKAQANLNLEEEIKKLDSQGIVHGIRTVKDLDEAAGAYKDIDIVMEEQKDLVEIVTKLSPIAVIKG